MTFLLIITIFLGLIFYLTYPNRLESGYKSFTNITHKIDPDADIKVISWNMAYLYGPGSEGINYEKKSKEYYEVKLKQAIDLIRSENPDIILMQEADIKAKKTHYINQAKEIADALGYNYACAKTWHCRYVPYPFKDLLNHFGYVESGGAILSKYKIDRNFVYLHKKPKKNYFFNLFYIYRFSQVVTIEIDDKKYDVVNNHLEAFSKINRMEQVKDILNLVENKNVLIIGGDLNTLPTSAEKKSNFTPYDIDDYIDDKSYDLISSQYKDTLPIESYSENEKEYFSFSSAHEDRKLDFIFCDKTAQTYDFKIIKSLVSDHYPISAIIKV